MIPMVDGGFSGTLVLMRSVVCRVMVVVVVVVVAINHARFLSVGVIMNCFRTRRTCETHGPCSASREPAGPSGRWVRWQFQTDHSLSFYHIPL